MRAKRLLGAVVLALALGLFLSLLAGGQQTVRAAPAPLFVKPGGTGTICSQSQPCSLPTALGKASPGTIIYAGGGRYTGTGSEVVLVDKSVTLYGGWDGGTVGEIVRNPALYPSVLDGQGARRVVRITGNVTPTVDGFVIAHGNATGQVANCDADQPDGCGGGIFVHDAHPVITHNVITGNVAAVTTSGYPTRTTGYGGGLYLIAAARAVISGNVIISNAASLANRGAGGGIYLNPYAATAGAQIRFNQVLSNTATTANVGEARGGGIHGGNDGVLIQGNTVAGNRANPYGGGQGSGLYQWFGSATYLGNLVTRNLGAAGGQAVLLGHSRSRFEGNRVVDNATAEGIWLGGSATLVNNVVARSGPKALSALGSPIFPLTATLLHNTLTGDGTGSGVFVGTDYVTLYLTNTIVASYTWGISVTLPAGTTVLPDHTLFWANAHDGPRGTHPVDGNPAFAPDGYHIRRGSAALDAGAPCAVTTDIDGEPRPMGFRPDIGADELPMRSLYLPLVLRN